MGRKNINDWKLVIKVLLTRIRRFCHKILFYIVTLKAQGVLTRMAEVTIL